MRLKCSRTHRKDPRSQYCYGWNAWHPSYLSEPLYPHYQATMSFSLLNEEHPPVGSLNRAPLLRSLSPLSIFSLSPVSLSPFSLHNLPLHFFHIPTPHSLSTFSGHSLFAFFPHTHSLYTLSTHFLQSLSLHSPHRQPIIVNLSSQPRLVETSVQPIELTLAKLTDSIGGGLAAMAPLATRFVASRTRLGGAERDETDARTVTSAKNRSERCFITCLDVPWRLEGGWDEEETHEGQPKQDTTDRNGAKRIT